MSRQRIDSIRRAIEQRKQEVPLNKIWAEICEDLGIGHIRGKKIHLSYGNIQALKAELSRLTNGHGVTLNQELDRIGLAGINVDEKLSRRNALARFIRISHSNNQMIFSGKEGENLCLFPDDSYIALAEKSLPLITPRTCHTVLVIENASLMEYTCDLKTILPPRFKEDTFYVYRGDGYDAGSVNRLIESLDSSIEVSCFADFDPSGICLAINQFKARSKGHFSLLVPESFDCLSRLSKSSAFWEQQRDIEKAFRLSLGNVELTKLLDVIQKQELAVTQESLVSHNISVKRLEIP